jgi:hypothetical protein
LHSEIGDIPPAGLEANYHRLVTTDELAKA